MRSTKSLIRSMLLLLVLSLLAVSLRTGLNLDEAISRLATVSMVGTF